MLYCSEKLSLKKEQLEQQDTETIVQLIAKSKRNKFVDKLIDALFKIQGGYSLVLMTNKS